MSRKGCCYYNAAMESFFHSLKVELIHKESYTTREFARQSIFEYIRSILQSAMPTFGDWLSDTFAVHRALCEDFNCQTAIRKDEVSHMPLDTVLGLQLEAVP